MPLLLLRMAGGETIAPMVGRFQGSLVMLRHWSEVFVMDDTASVAGPAHPGAGAAAPLLEVAGATGR
jgi:hypothetical protein